MITTQSSKSLYAPIYCLWGVRKTEETYSHYFDYWLETGLPIMIWDQRTLLKSDDQIPAPWAGFEFFQKVNSSIFSFTKCDSIHVSLIYFIRKRKLSTFSPIVNYFPQQLISFKWFTIYLMFERKHDTCKGKASYYKHRKEVSTKHRLGCVSAKTL